eukprot:TRINITY_DN2668_c0_g2_i1.p1 TRINITY_DN2668_c0_g2~~TRINITY_DN2668_c0_g2_i1.p1  ORF type:complete len:424 (+),score=102.42 TRINITY_DN2668_c0_g2_i1:83-1354(+)
MELLPIEHLQHIVLHLAIRDLAALACTCRYFHRTLTQHAAFNYTWYVASLAIDHQQPFYQSGLVAQCERECSVCETVCKEEPLALYPLDAAVPEALERLHPIVPPEDEDEDEDEGADTGGRGGRQSRKVRRQAKAPQQRGGYRPSVCYHRRWRIRAMQLALPCVKITVVGDGAVGKTSLCLRWLCNSAPSSSEYIPTNAAHCSTSQCMVHVELSRSVVVRACAFLRARGTHVPEHVIHSSEVQLRATDASVADVCDRLEGCVVRVNVRDTCGGEDYSRLRPLQYVGTDSVLMLASRRSLASLENIRMKWWPEALHHTEGAHDPTLLYSIAVTQADFNVAGGDGPYRPQCINDEAHMQQGCAWSDTVEAKDTPPLRVVPRFVSSRTGEGTQALLELLTAATLVERTGLLPAHPCSKRKKKCIVQ